MAPPLSVKAPAATVRAWLWALQRAPQGVSLPPEVLRKVLDFLTPWFFFDLDMAIAAAVEGARGDVAEVVLRRTWRMPVPTHTALVNPAIWGKGCYVSARVPKRARLVFRGEQQDNAAEKPRLRLYAPEAPGSCALMSLEQGAQVSVHDLSLEVFRGASYPGICKDEQVPAVVDVAWLPKGDSECDTKLELLSAEATGFTGHTRKRKHTEI